MTRFEVCGRIVRLVLAVFMLCVVTAPAEAGVKAWMKREAKMMAGRGVGHYQGVPRGFRAVGVGTDRNTCMFGGRCSKQLHKKIRGADGQKRVYSVRVWK